MAGGAHRAATARHTPVGHTPARHDCGDREGTALRTGIAAVTVGAIAVALPAAMASAGQDAPPVDTVVLQPAGVSTPDDTGSAGADRMLASIAPVAGLAEPEQPQLRVSDLVKAAGMAEAARAAQEREAAAECSADLHGLGPVKPWVRTGANFLSCLYDEPTVYGVASRGGSYSDHPGGRALDLMTGRERGDRIAECALANRDELGISYVIWRQRINYGDGWESMEDRGGVTANHHDHVHVSFDHSAPDGEPSAQLCD